MIKRTFYNLPSEKREKIIDVTKKEFQKGKKQKITINNVIKKAGISRGSFYQYFDDKLDLVELITDDMIAKMIDFIQDELMLNGGDIFEVTLRIFDVMTAKHSDFETIINLSPDVNQNSALISDYMQYRYRENDHVKKIVTYIDKSNLTFSDSETMECVIFMLFDIIKSSVFNISKNGKRREEERASLYRKVQIIKNGAVRKV